MASGQPRTPTRERAEAWVLSVSTENIKGGGEKTASSRTHVAECGTPCKSPLAVTEPEPKSPEPERAVAAPREVGIVYALVLLGTIAISLLADRVPGLTGYEQLLLAALFLVTAVRLARREPAGMRRFGIDLAGLLEPPDRDDPRPAGPLGIYDLARALRVAIPSAAIETAIAVGIGAVVFVPFVFGFRIWHFEILGAPSRAFTWVFDPNKDLELILTQLVVVALPEEAFFRGYVQTRLHDAWASRAKILGVPINVPAWIAQAALFAVIHVIAVPHPARLAVFFPALLFGWLRTWRGGIGAAIVLHALSNLLATLLERGYLNIAT